MTDPNQPDTPGFEPNKPDAPAESAQPALKKKASAGDEAPGWERATLEKLAFSVLNEQRSARRWKIFFRLPWLLAHA